MARDSILIVGSGALGCYFAARLAQHAEVTLLGTWPQGLAALRKHGVQLVGADGKERSHEVRATNDPADCMDHTRALVLVKSWQTARAAKQLSICLADDGVALTLQNGMGNLEILQSELGRERAAQGVTTTGATLLAPGRVREGGKGTIQIAEHPRVRSLVELLQAAGFTVEIAADMESVLWGKMIVNAAINPLTAILGIPNGILLQRPHARSVMRAVAAEVATVVRARAVPLPYDDPLAQVESVARQTADNRSSMLQDVARGAPTEIDAINGAIVQAAKEAAVDVPITETLWHLIHGLHSGNQGDEG